MTVLTLEVYLLLIFIIIAAASLFLCLLNALLLYTLWNRIEDLKRSYPDRRPVPDRQGASDAISQAIPAVHDPDRGRGRSDISSGIDRLARAYNLDSLVISTTDGLVVASSGSQDPEYEAAFYSADTPARMSGAEPGVSVFPTGYRDVPLIGIARGGTSLPSGVVGDLEADIRSLLSQGI